MVKPTRCLNFPTMKIEIKENLSVILICLFSRPWSFIGMSINGRQIQSEDIVYSIKNRKFYVDWNSDIFWRHCCQSRLWMTLTSVGAISNDLTRHWSAIASALRPQMRQVSKIDAYLAAKLTVPEWPFKVDDTHVISLVIPLKEWKLFLALWNQWKKH